jgi:hypothetical protein
MLFFRVLRRLGMKRKAIRSLMISLALTAAMSAAWSLDLGTSSRAYAVDILVGARHGSSGDLFYNYYVAPNCCSPGAAMYTSPVPTPPVIGHTYITYQPLMPHEFLYIHNRFYITHNDSAGFTRTRVRWW